ncbi:hypothetical protein H5V49_RS25000, partial [Escherichia coli]
SGGLVRVLTEPAGETPGATPPPLPGYPCHGTWFSPINKRQYGAPLTLTKNARQPLSVHRKVSPVPGIVETEGKKSRP